MNSQLKLNSRRRLLESRGMEMGSKRIFFIEGNISSGKTTAIESLRAQGYAVFEEPLDAWQRDYQHCGKNILELFYEDRKVWGFKFEIVSLMTRYKQLRAAVAALKNSRAVFIERSLLTDRYVFALNLYRGGFFEAIDWQIYCEWHDLFIELVESLGYRVAGTSTCADACTHADAVSTVSAKSYITDEKNIGTSHTTEYIYIRTSPGTCHERGLGRARREEDGVAPSYFQELHDHHEEWIRGMSGRTVHIIDGEGSREDIVREIAKILGPE